MSVPVSFIKQNNVEYEVADEAAREAIASFSTPNKKIIFIGDSYMTGESTGLPTITSFVEHFAEYCGLVMNTDVFMNAQSGYGFKDNGFKTLLQNVSIGTADPDDITDVIALGGINDANLIASDFSTFEQAMASFVAYAKATYVNAKVRVGYISKDYEGRFLFNINGVAAYKCINRNGGYYLTGVENVLREIGHFRSDGHPSEDGQKVLGRALVDAVFYGSCCPAYGSQPISITPASGITITANEMIASAHGGAVTISAHNWSKFTFASRSFTSPTDPLYIGEVNSGLVIGESDSYKYIPVTMILVGTTNYQVEGKLLFSNKGVYAYPWQQLEVPSGVTELRIAPFSVTFDSSCI